MPKRPLTVSELLKRLKPYGVIPLKRRGKGSETVLLLPDAENSKKGPIFTIRNHGKGGEVYIPVIIKILERFDINPDDFWV